MDAKTVLNYFEQITAIPRESGHEEPMTAFLRQFASERGLECKVDGIGNVLIVKPASAGRENVPTLVLQCHQDMVCEKVPGSAHDFLKDPIRYVIEDGWMIAKETTLGADDGIGIAACLALLDSGLPSGRLECLFTISEETGMDGAEYMQAGFFEGKTLINLDSEDEGQMFIGCAGGLNTTATFDVEYGDIPTGWTTLLVKVGGGQGGHSGDDINKERMNAVQQLARFLYAEKRTGMVLQSIQGGGKPNAIARDCEALICVPSDKDTLARVDAFDAALKDEFHVTDPAVFATAQVADPAPKALSRDLSDRLTDALTGCPHGVAAMSQDIEGLVETSTNLASVKAEGDKYIITTSQRSSILSGKRMISDKVEAVLAGFGAIVEHKYEYPGWKPNIHSHILAVCVESYKRLFGHEPEVKAIHAGLECGLFLEKFPGLDMISFGPTLRGVHAPGEKLELASLDKFVAHLTDVVSNFR